MGGKACQWNRQPILINERGLGSFVIGIKGIGSKGVLWAGDLQNPLSGYPRMVA